MNRPTRKRPVPATVPTTDICKVCGARCCGHVAIELDKPSTKRDYDNIRWMLMHKNVNVFVDHEGDWLVEFVTPCDRLGKDKRCLQYHDRPRVCRDYPANDDLCEHLGEDQPHRLFFGTAEQFERYLDKAGKPWRFRAHARGRVSGETAARPKTPSPSRTRCTPR